MNWLTRQISEFIATQRNKEIERNSTNSDWWAALIAPFAPLNFRQRKRCKTNRVSMNFCLCWLIAYARKSKKFYVPVLQLDRSFMCFRSPQRQRTKFTFLDDAWDATWPQEHFQRSKHAAPNAVFRFSAEKVQQKVHKSWFFHNELCPQQRRIMNHEKIREERNEWMHLQSNLTNCLISFWIWIIEKKEEIEKSSIATRATEKSNSASCC